MPGVTPITDRVPPKAQDALDKFVEATADLDRLRDLRKSVTTDEDRSALDDAIKKAECLVTERSKHLT